MYVIIFIIVVTFCLIGLVTKLADLKIRLKEIHFIQEMIKDFNLAFEQCKDCIEKQIEFSNSELGNENGEFEIVLDKRCYVVNNTKKMRKYLSKNGNNILRYENELVGMHRKMIKNSKMYQKFKSNLEIVQKAMENFDETDE